MLNLAKIYCIIKCEVLLIFGLLRLRVRTSVRIYFLELVYKSKNNFTNYVDKVLVCLKNAFLYLFKTFLSFCKKLSKPEFRMYLSAGRLWLQRIQGDLLS